MGRPALADEDRRSKRLQAMLTESEYAALKELADKNSRTVSDYARVLVRQAVESA